MIEVGPLNANYVFVITLWASKYLNLPIGKHNILDNIYSINKICFM